MIFYGHALPTKAHSNHCVKIIIGAKPVTVSFKHKTVKGDGIIIKSDTVHRANGGEESTISVYINPHTEIGKALNSLSESNVLKLEGKTSLILLNYFKNLLENHVTEPEIKSFITLTLFGVLSAEVTEVFHDERIKKVVAHIQSAPNYNVKFVHLLRLCNLSESRLIHLFKAEIGITIRKYILWCRVQKALTAMSSGYSIRQSARQAGFTDAAHFNRTFVSMFGINPSAIRK